MSGKKVNVLFAPDYRKDVPYQRFLADALAGEGINVSFLSGYCRFLPIYRGYLRMKPRPDIVHLHWPDAYFKSRNAIIRQLRKFRYFLDLQLLSYSSSLVFTAHNLYPHNRKNEFLIKAIMRYSLRCADLVFVHSVSCVSAMKYEFGMDTAKCELIPHGDYGAQYLPPLEKRISRQKLGLSEDSGSRVCLMIGAISPYKGLLEVVRAWLEQAIPHRLVIAGPISNGAYADQLTQLAQTSKQIELYISENGLSDEDLRHWLSAADCAIFNYTDIFTSGAASLARSFGLPLLIPSRLIHAELGEPHSHVFRFQSLENDFAQVLKKALRVKPDCNASAEWRAWTDWARVARITAAAYAKLLPEVS